MITESEFQLLERYRTNIIAEAAAVGFSGELQLQLEIAAAKFVYDVMLKLLAPVIPTTPAPSVTPLPTENNYYPPIAN
jgi:hypothetical protein